MIILGITGSIGMGKSTVSNLLRHLNIPVHDADACVHDLLQETELIQQITELFPHVKTAEHQINRRALGALIFKDKRAKAQLESLLHPLVEKDTARFIQIQKRLQCPMIALDIPLLFETNGQKMCDYVICVSSPIFVQKRRVQARTGMDYAVFKRIAAQQYPDAFKKIHADFILYSGENRAQTMRGLQNILACLPHPY
jgi:dephospho-CoA kinase